MLHYFASTITLVLLWIDIKLLRWGCPKKDDWQYICMTTYNLEVSKWDVQDLDGMNSKDGDVWSDLDWDIVTRTVLYHMIEIGYNKDIYGMIGYVTVWLPSWHLLLQYTWSSEIHSAVIGCAMQCIAVMCIGLQENATQVVLKRIG